MTTSLRPLVHVGYHKTGTSWVQRYLFNNAAAGFVRPVDEYEAIQGRLVYVNGLDFDPEACRRYFEPILAETMAKGQVPVLSSERLCGNLFAGGYDTKDLADRLRAVVPDARVLIVIREQKTMIASSYKQYVRAGGACKLSQFLAPADNEGTKMPAFDLDHFKYHRLIGYYQKLFTPENVLVLAYEQLRTAPQTFVRQIVEFAGLNPEMESLANVANAERENESLAGIAVSLKRRLNFVVRDRLNPWASVPLPRGKRKLLGYVRGVSALVPPANRVLERRSRDRIAHSVGERYRASNQETMRLTGLDLAAFGYDA